MKPCVTDQTIKHDGIKLNWKWESYFGRKTASKILMNTFQILSPM